MRDPSCPLASGMTGMTLEMVLWCVGARVMFRILDMGENASPYSRARGGWWKRLARMACLGDRLVLVGGVENDAGLTLNPTPTPNPFPD